MNDQEPITKNHQSSNLFGVILKGLLIGTGGLVLLVLVGIGLLLGTCAMM